MKPSNFIIRLKKIFPVDSWPQVLFALRQDPMVWEALENSELGERALKKLSPQAEKWSPARLALLLIDEGLQLERFTQSHSEPLDVALFTRASQEHEAWIQNNNGITTLDQAGLLALFLREQRRLKSSWESQLINLVKVDKNAGSILACLYGMTPDPFNLLLTAYRPTPGLVQPKLVLHALLSNPEPETKKIKILSSLLETMSLDEGLEFLSNLYAERPWMTSEIAQEYLSRKEMEFSREGLEEKIPNLVGYIQETSELAGISKLAGLPTKAVRLLSNSLRSMRLLKGHLSAELARSIDQARHESGPQERDSALAAVLDAWQQATNLDPDELDHQAGLATAYIDAGKFDEAQTELKTWMEADTLPPNAHICLAVARIYANRGDSSKAIDVAQKALEAEENLLSLSEDDFNNLISIFFELNLFSESARVAICALRKFPTSVDILGWLARAQYALGRYIDSLSTVNAALAALQLPSVVFESEIDVGQLSLLSIKNLEAMGDWETALVERDTWMGTTTAPGVSEWRDLARCCVRAGQPERALEACRIALEFDENDAITHSLMGEAYLEMGDADRAFESLKFAIHLMPHNGEVWLALAKAQAKDGKTEDAIQTLRTAAQAVPDALEIHMALGESYLKQRLYTQALESFRQAEKLNASAHVLLRLGQMLLRLGYSQEARQALEKAQQAVAEVMESEKTSPAIDYKNHLITALDYAYSKYLMEHDEKSQALRLLEKVVESLPEAPGPQLDLAIAIMGKQDRSIKEIQRAASLLEKVVDSEVELDFGYLEQDASLDVLKSHALGVLAEVYAEIGDLERALDYYQRALNDPHNSRPEQQARLAIGFGRVSIALDQPETAAAVLEEAARSDPRNPEIYCVLSESYLASELAVAAFQSAKTALDLSASSLEMLVWFVDQISRIQRIPGHAQLPIRAEVFKALEVATQLAPSRVDLLLRLGKILVVHGEREGALDVFRKLASSEESLQKLSDNDLYYLAKAVRDLGDARLALNLFQTLKERLSNVSSEVEKEESIPSSDLYAEISLTQRRVGNTDEALNALDLAISLEPKRVDLYISKGELFDEMGKPEATLDCLKTALSLDASSASVQHHAALIMHQLGDLPGALAHIEQAVFNAEETADPSELHQSRMVAAELSYLMLKPRQAWEYIHADLLSSKKPCDHFEHACLRAEMALDFSDGAMAADNVTAIVEATAHEAGFRRARSLADQSRLEAKKGNLEYALDLIQSAQETLYGGMDANSLISKDSSFIAAFRAICHASLDLRLWQNALDHTRQLTEVTPREPFSHLQMVKVLVASAEAACLYQDLNVRRAGADETALTDEARQSFEIALNVAQLGGKVQELSDHGETSPQSDENVIQATANWEARGTAVFAPDQGSAYLLGKEVKSRIPQAEDLAALMLVLRRIGESASAVKAAHSPWAMTLDGRNITSHPLVMLQVALAYQEAEPEKALQVVSQALEKNSVKQRHAWPDMPLLNFLKARLAFQNGEKPTALQSIMEALAAWPEEARWHHLAAQIYQEIPVDGKETHADMVAWHLEEAARLEPDNPTHLNSLADFYLERGDFNLAKQALEEGEQTSPELEGIWLKLAKSYLTSGDLENSAYCADRAIEHSSNPNSALLIRGEIALQAQNPRGALQHAQTILDEQHNHAEAMSLMAHALEAMDRIDESLLAYEKTIQLLENPLPSQIERLKLLSRVKGTEVALPELQDLAAKNPLHPDLISLMANWLFESGRHKEALKLSQNILQDSSNGLSINQRAKLHYQIGSEMRRAGHLDQAIYHLDHSIKLIPEQLDYYLELGKTFQDQRAHDQALKVFKEAIGIAPKDYRPYFQAGQSLKDAKDYPAAEIMLRHAARLAPDEVSVHRLLGAVSVLNLIHHRRTNTKEADPT